MTSEDPHDFADADPLTITKLTAETDGAFFGFELTLHPAVGETEADDRLSHRRWIVDNPDEHLHPHQDERIEVLSGEYRVAIEETVHTLSEGEEITVPSNTPHRHWNPTGRPIRVAHEYHPARQVEALICALYALAQAGETDEGGMPNALQLAVLNAAYPENVYLTNLPVAVQKAVIALLAPFGRLAGYEANIPSSDCR